MIDSCYYYGKCGQTNCKGCSFYDPITDDAQEEMLYRLIENERERFRAEWFQYVSSYNFD